MVIKSRLKASLIDFRFDFTMTWIAGTRFLQCYDPSVLLAALATFLFTILQNTTFTHHVAARFQNLDFLMEKLLLTQKANYGSFGLWFGVLRSLAAKFEWNQFLEFYSMLWLFIIFVKDRTFELLTWHFQFFIILQNRGVFRYPETCFYPVLFRNISQDAKFFVL